MSILEDIKELHEQRWKEAEERARKILYGDKSTPEKKTEGTVFIDIETTVPGKTEIRTVTVPNQHPRSVFAPLPEPEDLGQQAREDRLFPKGRKTESEKTPYQKYQKYQDLRSSESKGFTPEARAEFNARMKAQGIVTMTPDGEIDAPKRSGSRRSGGVFRRS